MPAISWRQAMVTTATRGTRKGGKERRERKGKRQGEKGRKSLARAPSLKWFGERWHAKLESSVSPSPLWLHIKRNREKFFPTKINGARGTTRSLNNTDYLVCALSESVRISSCLIKVLLLFFPRTQVCANFPTIQVQLFKSLAKKKKKSAFLFNRLSVRKKAGPWPKTLNKQNIYKAFVVYKRQDIWQNKWLEVIQGFCSLYATYQRICLIAPIVFHWLIITRCAAATYDYAQILYVCRLIFILNGAKSESNAFSFPD